MPLRDITKFTIRRKQWLRGEGPTASYLFRPDDGKMCCVGIYLKACGFQKKHLRECSTPDHMEGVRIPAKMTRRLLILENDSVYTTNDDEENGAAWNQARREKEIAATFKKAGITVIFKD